MGKFIEPLPNFLRYRDEGNYINKQGDEVPNDKNDLVVEELPTREQLIKYIARHLTYTDRVVRFTGFGFDKLKMLTDISGELLPWQYRYMVQHNGTEQFEASFICIKEWISGDEQFPKGKYKKWV